MRAKYGIRKGYATESGDEEVRSGKDYRRHVESSKGKRASNMTVCIHLRETAVAA